MDLTEFTKATVVEWSPRQKCFHVFTVGNMLEHNRRAFFEGMAERISFRSVSFRSTETLMDFLKKHMRIGGRWKEKAPRVVSNPG